MTISHNLWNQLIKNRFQHSDQTIHEYFHEVLVAMVNFLKEMISPSSSMIVQMVSLIII